MRSFLAIVALALVTMTLACELVSGLDKLELAEGTSAAAGGSGGAGQGGAGGAGGQH